MSDTINEDDNKCHVCGESLDSCTIEDFEGDDVHQECLAGAARMSQYSKAEDEAEAVRKGLA